MNNDANQHRKELKEVFAKLFKSRGYTLDSYFTSKVWFLQEDKEFQLIVNPSENQETIRPCDTSNPILGILRTLASPKDLKTMSINVETFIMHIIDLLIRTQNKLDSSLVSIREYSAHKQVNEIPDIINLISSQPTKASQSTLIASVQRVDNLKRGNYDLTIVIKDINKGELSYNMNTPITVSNSNDMIILTPVNKYTFPTVKFWANNNIEQFTNEQQSGTIISSYYFVVQHEGKFYCKTKERFIFYDFINSMQELCKTQNHIISIKVTCDLDNTVIKEELTPYLYFTFDLELDTVTRISVLNQMQRLFRSVINTKSDCSNFLNDLLDKNFFDIAENVKYILDKKNYDVHRDCCSPGCITY